MNKILANYELRNHYDAKYVFLFKKKVKFNNIAVKKLHFYLHWRH